MWTRSCFSLSASSLCWLVESVKSRYVSSVDPPAPAGSLDQQPSAFCKSRQEKTPREESKWLCNSQGGRWVRWGSPKSVRVGLLGWFFRETPPVGDHRAVAWWQLSAYDGETDSGVWGTKLSLGRKRHARCHYYSECHDGRQNPTHNLARRSHCGGHGLWNGEQTSPLPWGGVPYILHVDSEEEHEG